jgi:acetyl esterase/lipase
MFSKKDINSGIDIAKARRFDKPYPPNKLKKNAFIENKKFLNTNVFYIQSKKHEINNSRIILYFHGGAFISGITGPHWNFVEKLSASSGCRIILPEYPLAPECNYIDTTNFAFELYKHLLIEYDSLQIQIIGDSAGGNLSLTLSLLLNKNLIQQPARLILLSPWLDLSLSNPEIKKLEKYDIMLSTKKLFTASKLYSNNTDTKNFLISPIYGDLKTLPETHIFIGNHDLLFADSIRFRNLAEASGANIKLYEYNEMMHVWMIFPIPEALEVIKQINKIFDAK